MKKILLCSGVLLLAALFSCKDFLEVASPSKFDSEYVFNRTTEDINNTLSAVYSSLMDNSTYGQYLSYGYALNSDVEFKSFSNPPLLRKAGDFACFDGDRYSGDILNTWQKAYEGIERANIFITGVEASPLMEGHHREQLLHWLGEAKCLRAMFYYDLVVLWGDIPFRTTPSYEDENLFIGLTDRQEILTWLINDLRGICTDMKWASEVTVERASREFCFGLIARLALTRGGYALYPDKNNPNVVGTMKRAADYLDYYEIARDYADSVIMSGRHALNKSFRRVFVDQCNYIVDNMDDIIFEIPFLIANSGRLGYDTGPAASGTNNVTTHTWGPTSGSGITLNPLYIFSFDDKDLRRDFTVSTWDYSGNAPVINLGITQRVGKWSKLWNHAGGLGNNSTAFTGINFPYMRFAEVLLIYAEAENELNSGPTSKAKAALKYVRSRAFSPADHASKVQAYVDGLSSKEEFFEAIFNERAWEFGGENMRWKDLVRWNLYSKVVYEQFKAMKGIAWNLLVGGNPDSEALDAKYEHVPPEVFYKVTSNPDNIDVYPNLGGMGNNNMYIIEFADWPWGSTFVNGYSSYTNWFNRFIQTSLGKPHDAILYSFRGYIYGGTSTGGGPTTGGNDMDSKFSNINNLPPVRYILPIPNLVLVTHNHTFGNYYGYQ